MKFALVILAGKNTARYSVTTAIGKSGMLSGIIVVGACLPPVNSFTLLAM